jgi:opacity protein-like surface antigen
MSLKKLITSAAVSAIAAGSLVPLSTVASANEWNHHGGRGHASNGAPRFERNFDNDRGRVNRWGEHREHRQYNAWRGNNDDDGGYRRHRNHNGRNLAIGAFAAILGLAIAAEASRGHQYDDGDND